MTDLSPAARAVWEAFRQFDEAGMHVNYDVKIAAALRAAADQLYDSASQDYLWKLANELESING